MLGKLILFLLTGLIILALLMRKWMGLFLKKNNLLRHCDSSSLLNWIGALALSTLLKLLPRKLEPFFLLRLLFISINLPYSFAWNTIVTSGLVLLSATWICSVSYRSRYEGLLVQHLLPLLKSWVIVEI